MEFFDGILAWLEAGQLNLGSYDQSSFKMGPDVHTIALDDDDRLLALKPVPQEAKLEQHAIAVSITEIALIKISLPRAKSEKPDLQVLSTRAFKCTSVDAMLVHRQDEKNKSYLVVVIVHDSGSISQALLNLSKQKWH